MSEDTKQSFEGAIFIGDDGNKYATNPFATGIEDSFLKPRFSDSEQEVSMPFNNYCAMCDVNFEDLKAFAQHNMGVHMPKKLLSCTMCDTKFRRRDHLKRHIQSLHLADQQCKCPLCDQVFQGKDMLRQHAKEIHSDKQNAYKCKECDFICHSSLELDIHELVHTCSDARLECTHCKKTFKRRDHMLRHVKTQHLNYVVSCPLCGQMYKRKDHVARHIREKHKMNPGPNLVVIKH